MAASYEEASKMPNAKIGLGFQSPSPSPSPSPAETITADGSGIKELSPEAMTESEKEDGNGTSSSWYPSLSVFQPREVVDGEIWELAKEEVTEAELRRGGDDGKNESERKEKRGDGNGEALEILNGENGDIAKEEVMEEELTGGDDGRKIASEMKAKKNGDGNGKALEFVHRKTGEPVKEEVVEVELPGGADDEKDTSGSNGREKMIVPLYPVRPGKSDCSYYLKTGTCGYRAHCIFNHPPRYGGNSVKASGKIGLQLQIDTVHVNASMENLSLDEKKEKPLAFYSSEAVAVDNFKGWDYGKGENVVEKSDGDGWKGENAAEESDCDNRRAENAFPESGWDDWKGENAPEKSGWDDWKGESIVDKSGWGDWKGENAVEKLGWDDDERKGGPKHELNGDKGWMVFKEDEEKDKAEVFYPERPGKADCPYYMKTGTCAYGVNCKFNHPPKMAKTQVVDKTGSEGPIEGGQTECKYYLLPGGCKFGKACKYDHSREKLEEQAVVLNFLGLPLRPGQKECPYYMRTGACKFSSSCWYNHPNPSAVSSQNSIPDHQNSGSSQLHAWMSSMPQPTFFQQTQNESPSLPTAPHPSYMPTILFPPKRLNTNPNYNDSQQLQVEFPERPGQPECPYFMKTGDCKFKSACKFHHPRSRLPKAPTCSLTPHGLPLRPDQPICSFYSRFGICKYGPACKFNHPTDFNPPVSAPARPFGQMMPSGNGRTQGVRMVERNMSVRQSA